MSFKTFRALLLPIFVAVSLIPVERSFAASPSAPALTNSGSPQIAQAADADLERRLQEQREAERVLKEDRKSVV